MSKCKSPTMTRPPSSLRGAILPRKEPAFCIQAESCSLSQGLEERGQAIQELREDFGRQMSALDMDAKAELASAQKRHADEIAQANDRLQRYPLCTSLVFCYFYSSCPSLQNFEESHLVLLQLIPKQDSSGAKREIGNVSRKVLKAFQVSLHRVRVRVKLQLDLLLYGKSTNMQTLHEYIISSFRSCSENAGQLQKQQEIFQRNEAELSRETQALERQAAALKSGLHDADRKISDLQQTNSMLKEELQALNKEASDNASKAIRVAEEMKCLQTSLKSSEEKVS